jgi:hypothetical protein
MENIQLATVGVFLLTGILGALAHELGHFLAGKWFGLRHLKLVFAKVEGSNVPLPFFGIDVCPREMLTISITARRIIFVAGAVVDIAVGILVLGFIEQMHFPHIVKIGILYATTFRLGIFWLNLIPVETVRSDGWRILHPNSMV